MRRSKAPEVETGCLDGSRGVGGLHDDEDTAPLDLGGKFGQAHGQVFLARELELRVVIIVEIVDANDLVASREKNLHDIHSNEVGCTSDWSFH